MRILLEQKDNCVVVVLPLDASATLPEGTLAWVSDQRFEQTQDEQALRILVPKYVVEDLSRLPRVDDEESVDCWVRDHQHFSNLIGVGAQQVRVVSIGFAGGAHFVIQASVNGSEITKCRPETLDAVGKDGSVTRLSPLVFGALEHLSDDTARSTDLRSRHLHIISSLRHTLDTAAKLFREPPTLVVDFDEHLTKYTPRRLTKPRLGWVADGADRYSLKVEHQGASGSYESVDVSKLDAREPIINVDPYSPFLLDADEAAIARIAANNQNRAKRHISSLEDPLSLIPDGVDATHFELLAYSDRVLGFEPASAQADRDQRNYGMRWFTDHGEAGTGFSLDAQMPSGESVKLHVAGEQEARAYADAVESALRAGSTSDTPTCSIGGTEVRATPELASHLRNAARMWNVGLPAPEAPRDHDESDDTVQQSRPAGRLAARLAEQEELVPDRLDPEIVKSVPWPELEAMLSDKYKLLPHQRVGIAWLWSRYKRGASGALLSDDMGLGKTLQIACFLALVRRHPRDAKRAKRPSMIVAPVGLLDNWAEELQRYFGAPDFPGKLRVLHGDALQRVRTAAGDLDIEAVGHSDVVLVNYETLSRFQKSLLGIDWQCVVLDEAQRIKNPNTAMSKAARGLAGVATGERPRKFDFGICATGTPVENAVDDLWPLFDFISPGQPFTTFRRFRDAYSESPNAAAELSALLRVGHPDSAVLRRTKATELAHLLPAKRYFTTKISMTDAQLVQEARITHRDRLAKFGALAVLQDLQKLYQHPWLLSDNASDLAAAEIDDAIRISPKLEATLRILSTVREKQEKVLVFTIWHSMQDLLRRVLCAKLGLRRIAVLNGEENQRGNFLRHIEEFSSSPGFDLMILSPLAAGVGLNITAANHVVHYGRWWNPAREDQATDRAYRIGQKNAVSVHYPVLHHPADESAGFDVRLDELVAKKRGLTRDLFAPAEEQFAQRELAGLVSVGG